MIIASVCPVSLTPPGQQQKILGQLLRNHFNPSPQPPNREFQQLIFQQAVLTECQAICGAVEVHCLLGAFV